MKISIVVYGTRGDIQPMLALANELIKNGHEIVFCANPENEELVNSFNCSFIAIGPNLKEQLRICATEKKKPDRFSLSSFKELKKEIEKQMDILPAIIDGSDLVLGAGIIFGVPTAADKAGIPYRLVIFYPFALGSGKNDSWHGNLKLKLTKFFLNAFFKKLINKKRLQAGLQSIDDIIRYYWGEHVIVASDAALNPVPEGVKAKYTQTGYMFLPAKNGLPENVEKFIASGKPPFFIGFGSNPITAVNNPKDFTEMFELAAKSTNQRFIISKGWSVLTSASSSADILYVDDMPYEILFPRMAAIIHHGGTGTMSYAAKAGIPQAAFPYMSDQFINRKQIVKLGIGPVTCDFKKISAIAITEAITDLISNEKYKKKAIEISKKIIDADGLKLTVDLIEKELKNKISGY
jgi:vancomycin aglycone glucosyltransferase